MTVAAATCEVGVSAARGQGQRELLTAALTCACTRLRHHARHQHPHVRVQAARAARRGPHHPKDSRESDIRCQTDASGAR
jgi:hypothetical protein